MQVPPGLARDRKRGVFFLITLVLVAGSRSATGIILATLLNGVVILYFLWLLVRARIKKWHYSLIGARRYSSWLLLAVWKMDAILGVLGRNSSLTGRIPLWNYLMTNFISQRPWLGHGFGVFWGFEWHYRVETQTSAGMDVSSPDMAITPGWISPFTWVQRG